MNLAKYRWPVATQALERMLAEFRPDVVVANNLHMGSYLLGLAGPALILREQNIDSDLMERYAATFRNPFMAAFVRRQARLVRKAETAIAPRAHRCVMITPVDEARIHQIAPGAQTAVVPGVIAPEEYRPARRPGPGDELLVVATGTFTFLPTGEGLVHFIEHVWPRVIAAAPRARFRVIGHCPEALRRRLEALQGIEVLGRVDSVEAHLDGATVFAVPLRAGSGMRMKIVEAMAWQVPIVTTSIGCEGIGVENGRQVIVADEPQAMATAILGLHRDTALAQNLRSEGRRFVEEHFSLSAAGRQTDRIYRECIESPAAGGETPPTRRSS
jgi:glycosyltransferase involved in cell wall biosynthesis